MYDVYLEKITIKKVRHLENIVIPLGDDEKKHLIITGKNGSGKTSLLQALSKQLDFLSTQSDFASVEKTIGVYKSNLEWLEETKSSENDIENAKRDLHAQEERLSNARCGLDLQLNVPFDGLKSHFEKGEFILAYYEATRKFDAVIPKHLEKVNLKDNYRIKEFPRNEFVKYILDLKMTEALARTSGKQERAEKISNWFINFENLLKQIFEDDSIQLLFDEETFTFSLSQNGRDIFDFQELSDGFAAILDIVVDLMVRMEKHLDGGLSFDLPGIVLIDEIETHLHLELQRKVLDFLTNVFPNIQFIISTHSPFILTSAKNTVVFDLENRILVESGLNDLPYEGVVEGYFKVDNLSMTLRGKFERYKELVGKDELSENEMEEIANIELYLDEIPDYLALGITTEYRRLKAEFESREDL